MFSITSNMFNNETEYLETFKKEKECFKNEIISYYGKFPHYPEKEVSIKCATDLVDNLRNVKSFNVLRTLSFNKDKRLDAIGEWILNRINNKNRKEGNNVYRDLIGIETKYQNYRLKVECLQKLYEIALQNKKDNEDNDSDIEDDSSKISLAEATYRFFRYNNKNITLLDSKGFNFSKLIEGDRIRFEDKLSVIISDCQAGKTFLAIPVMLIYLALGFTPVVVVLDTSQVTQLVSRLNESKNDLIRHLEKCGFPTEYFDSFDKILYYDSNSPLKKTDKDLENALNGTKRRIIIVIKHHSHVNRVNKLFTEDSNVVLIADEAQQSGCYKHLEDENGEYHNDDIKYEHEYVQLKERAVKCISITATAQDILMVDNNLWSDNIIYIPPGSDYIGLRHCEFLNINFKKTDVLEIIENLSTLDPIERTTFRFSRKDRHPINVLMKTMSKVEDQFTFMTQFPLKNLNEVINNANWVVINFTGTNGILIYHDSLRRKELIIKNHKSIVLKHGIHQFKNGSINITDAYQYFADQGVEKFPRLITIAYDFASEAISFISNYSKPNNYHLTHGIFNLSDTINTANAIQTVSRLFGNHGDTIQPVIYCSQKIREKVFKGFELHDTQVKTLISLSQTGNTNVVCSDYLKELKVYKNRVSNKYNKIKGVSINKVRNPCKSQEEKILKNDSVKCIEYLYCVNPDKYEVVKNELKTSGFYKEPDATFDVVGYCIDEPKEGTINYEIYNKTVNYIRGKGWIRQSDIRHNADIDDTRRMNALRGRRNSGDYVTGHKGLLWRKEGSQYEYCFC